MLHQDRPAALLFILGAFVASALIHCNGGGDSSALAAGAGPEDYDAKPPDACVAGQIVCLGDTAHVCAAGGSLVDPVVCDNEQVCVDGLGCAACVPETGSCSEGIATWCPSDGSAAINFPCDPVQGLSCEPQGCAGPCAPSSLGRTHVGCDFWPTVTGNSAWRTWFGFGIVATSTTDDPTRVVITRGSGAIEERTIEPRGYGVIELPWIAELKGPDATSSGTVVPMTESVWSRAVDGSGAYRVRSDRPIVVMQFNTLRAEVPMESAPGCPDPHGLQRCLSYSNDGTLLIPTSALGSSFDRAILGWRAWLPSSAAGAGIPDFLSVTATANGTRVALTPTTATIGGYNIPALSPGEKAWFDLDEGDVLQLLALPSSSLSQWAGSSVEATQPIQVITGSSCASVPADVGACDHLEDWLSPSPLLGRRYLLAAPRTPDGIIRHVVRVQAVTDDTVVHFDPATVHSPAALKAGEVVDVDSKVDFQVSAQKPLVVAQFMVGHEATPAPTKTPQASYGDPSQAFVVPVSRYLKSYAFTTPPGFEYQSVSIVAATGSSVSLDAQPIGAAFEAVGTSGLSVASVPLEPGRRYELSSDQPCSAQLYGYGVFTSFMMPIGVDLRPPVAAP